MAMKMKNGTLATNAKENMSVFGMHFHNVLNNHRPIDMTVLDLIQQKPRLDTIDAPITFREVKTAINKLKKGKSPGLNGIPREALKAMNDTPRRIVHKHVSDFFEGKTDHAGWHRSQCIPVPKKGDLSDPNKWRGIMLMDICSKVFSSVLNTRAFLLLEKHGTRFQFGGTPEVGCRDGLFTLKTLINAHQNHDLTSYVGFIDLIKAYDTANHTLLLRILERYGAPPKFVTAIETIYKDNVAVLKIENEVVEIPQTVGVRQGDNMAPVLFLFLMTAFAETLELVWEQQGIPILNVMTTADDKLSEGRICSHTPAMFASNSLKAYKILQCLYVDDIGIPFGTRKDLQQGMELIFHHFARFGLEMHIGRGTTTSKTECVFFPPPQFFQHKRAREKAATTIQRAYRHTRKSRQDQPSYELEAVIETTGKTHHKNGTKVRKMFNDEYGVRRPFAGIVENYDETRELYWIVYKDGDSEEMTHEEVLLFWSTNTNIQPTQSPTALSIPPSTTFFAVGSRVTIIPSHHTHGGKDGVVTRHTAKFVVIALNGKETRILPKSILPHPQKTPNPGSTNSSALPPTPSITHVPDDDDAPTPDETELEGSIYDKLDETQNVPVADGFISFTRTFRYLGSLISYSLRDDDDVTARIAAANSAMGALKEVWRNPHLDVYNKYLLFRAIPMNLLLWGCETRSLQQSLLDKLEEFLH